MIFQDKKVSIPSENVKFIKHFIKIYINGVLKQLEAKGLSIT